MDEDQPTDIHAASEEERMPGDGRRSFTGLVIAVVCALATVAAALLLWRALKS